MTIDYIDLFCGIGGFRYAITKASQKHKLPINCVFSSDIDNYAKTSYHENFGDLPYGDITKISPESIPNHHILFAGFPCQPFSIIGKGKGFEDTRGTLFFEIASIIKEKKPIAFVLENVKRLVSHDNGETFKKILKILDDLGYHIEFKIMNALDYGLPQKRERVVIQGFYKKVDFNWPTKRKLKPLSSVLEKNVDQKHFASKVIVNKRNKAHNSKFSPSIWHENKSGNISSYPYSMALRAGASYNYLLVDGLRRLSPREMLRLQGFPESFKIAVSDAQIRKQAGNAVPVNMIRLVLENLLPMVKDEIIILNSEKNKFRRIGCNGKKKISKAS